MTRERANELLPVITAFAEGKTVEWMPDKCSQWYPNGNPGWMDEAAYRIKPEPRLRPWKPEEVPVGAVVVYKDEPSVRRQIVSVDGTSLVCLGGTGGRETADLLNNWQLADGKPCGVLEPQP